MKTGNYILRLIVTASVALLMVSCIKESFHTNNPAENNNGKVKVMFSLPERDKVNTRAATDKENALLNGNIYSFSFDEYGVLQDMPTKVQFTESGNTYYYFADLDFTTEKRVVYVVANALVNLQAKAVEQGWESGVTTLEEITNSYLTKSWKNEDNGIVTERFTSNHPMEGNITLDKIDSHTTIEVPLKRVTAKAVVKVNTVTVSNFTLQGVSILNGTVNAPYLEGAKDETYSAIETAHYAKTADLDDIFKGVVTVAETEPVYMWESKVSEKHTAILIKAAYKGVDGYYKLDFIDFQGVTIDIVRNTEYTVTITNVKRIGYRTAQEALDNTAANAVGVIEVDIIAKDPNAHDIVTNGEYYMGFSNSEFRIYQDLKSTDEITVTTLVHNALSTSGISPGTITASAGIILVSGSTIPLAASESYVANIVVRFADSFTSGTLTFRLGNMRREIAIYRNASLEFIEYQQLLGSDISYAELPENYQWFGFRAGISTSSVPVVDVSLGTAVDMVFGENIGDNNTPATERSAEFYAFRSTSEGRIKVMVTQSAFNLGAENASAGELPYIGTFHRANQTGERVLRFDQGVNSYWRATVLILDGTDDFIRLSTAGSQDPNIHTANAKTGDEIETVLGSQFAIASGYNVKSVQGVSREILFRVGMTDKLNGGDPEAAPRYGVILLQHSGGVQYIYVRQGEAADYMMRPGDGWFGTGTWSTGNRQTYARKVSPFNLSVAAGTSFTSGRYQANYQGGRFADFPSQAGTFYQWHYYYAYMPTGTATLVTNPNGKGNSSSAFDPCPNGYHTPGDGVVYGSNSGAGASSEFRYSFFAYVPISYIEVSVSAQRFGCYADGWFDRLQPNVSTKIVSDGLSVAYVGRIFYNPTPDSDAHIFLPFTGTRVSLATTVTESGMSGHYLTSSGCESTNHPGVFNITSTSASFEHNNLSYNSAYTIRCVRNE